MNINKTLITLLYEPILETTTVTEDDDYFESKL